MNKRKKKRKKLFEFLNVAKFISHPVHPLQQPLEHNLNMPNYNPRKRKLFFKKTLPSN